MDTITFYPATGGTWIGSDGKANGWRIVGSGDSWHLVKVSFSYPCPIVPLVFVEHEGDDGIPAKIYEHYSIGGYPAYDFGTSRHLWYSLAEKSWVLTEGGYAAYAVKDWNGDWTDDSRGYYKIQGAFDPYSLGSYEPAKTISLTPAGKYEGDKSKEGPVLQMPADFEIYRRAKNTGETNTGFYGLYEKIGTASANQAWAVGSAIYTGSYSEGGTASIRQGVGDNAGKYEFKTKDFSGTFVQPGDSWTIGTINVGTWWEKTSGAMSGKKGDAVEVAEYTATVSSSGKTTKKATGREAKMEFKYYGAPPSFDADTQFVYVGEAPAWH